MISFAVLILLLISAALGTTMFTESGSFFLFHFRFGKFYFVLCDVNVLMSVNS